MVSQLAKLNRLVSYKISQLQILDLANYHSLDSDRLEKSIDRENRYAASCGESAAPSACEKAMLEYYFLLEKNLLTRLNQMSLDVHHRILTQKILKKVRF